MQTTRDVALRFFQNHVYQICDGCRDTSQSFPEPVCSNGCCGRFQACFPNHSNNSIVCNNSAWMVFQPNFYLLYVVCLKTLHEGNLQRCMKEIYRGCSSRVISEGRRSMCTLRSRVKSTISTFFEWGQWPFSVRKTGYFLDGFTKRTKCLNHCVKLSFWIHSALWQTAIEPGGVLSRSSAYMLLLGNTRRRGAYVTLAFT